MRLEKPTLSSDNDSVIRINCQWFKTVAKQVVILPFFWLNMAAPSPHGRSADSRQRLRSQNPNFNMHDIHRWVLEALKCKTKMTFNLYWLQKCHILICSNGAVHQRRAWQNERCLHLHDLTIHSSKCNFTFLFNLHKRTS